jgi:hypothetical protein
VRFLDDLGRHPKITNKLNSMYGKTCYRRKEERESIDDAKRERSGGRLRIFRKQHFRKPGVVNANK